MPVNHRSSDAQCLTTPAPCSPAENSMSCGGVLGYYCHTAADLCGNDSDCGSDLQACTYATTAGHWEYQMAGLCAL